MGAHGVQLTDLLGPVSIERFLAEHWDQAPLLVRADTAGGPTRFQSVLTLDAFDQLISGSGLRGSTLRVARDGQAVSPSTWAVPALPWGPGKVAHFARPERMHDLLRDGWTVVLENADRTCGPVAAVAHALRQSFAADCYVHTFHTPAGNRAFAPHYDVQNAFIVQCSGAKRWRVHAPHVHRPLRDEACPAGGVEPGELVLDVRLEAGDMLFVPRGFVHAVSGVPDVHSLHVTFGVVPTTWHDVVQQVVSELRSAVGGPGDQAIRLDSRRSVALSEDQEDWIDEQVEDTLLDVGIERIAQAVARRRSGPSAAPPPLSSALTASAVAPTASLAPEHS